MNSSLINSSYINSTLMNFHVRKVINLKKKHPNLIIEGNIINVSFMIRKRMQILIKVTADKLGLTVNEMELLMFLNHSPHDTARDFVRHSGCSRSLASKIVYGLVSKGYVTQEVDASDRRIVHLIPTEKARKAISEIDNAVVYLEKQSLQGISDEDIDNARDVMNKILENYKRILEENE